MNICELVKSLIHKLSFLVFNNKYLCKLFGIFIRLLNIFQVLGVFYICYCKKVTKKLIFLNFRRVITEKQT